MEVKAWETRERTWKLYHPVVDSLWSPSMGRLDCISSTRQFSHCVSEKVLMRKGPGEFTVCRMDSGIQYFLLASLSTHLYVGDVDEGKEWSSCDL
jgi:hypothetical protein